MRVSKFILKVWLKLCQYLGLFLIEFNSRKGRFERWKYSSIYCSVIGVSSLCIYFYASVKLFFLLKFKFMDILFTLIISNVQQTCHFLFVIVAYCQHYRMRNKICETLNNFLCLFKSLQWDIKNFSTLARNMKKCEKLFATSLFIKFYKYVISFGAFYLLPGKSFSIIFFALSCPYLVTLASYNQFFLGVITTQYSLTVINDRIARLHENLNNEVKDLTFEIEQISVLHTRLFEMMKDLLKYFGLQVSFAIFNNVLNIIVSGFQIFSTVLLAFVNSKIDFETIQLLSVGLINISIIVFDLMFHIKLCILCMDEVIKFRLKLKKIFVIVFLSLGQKAIEKFKNL
jgi:hypothetical protein